MEDLQNLLGLGKMVTLSNGREQKMLPLKFRQFGLVSAILKRLKINVLEGDVDVMALVADHHEEVAEILHIALGWPLEEVQDLYLDDIATLTLAMIEVNGNFFSQRMLPALEKLKAASSGRI